MRIAFNAKVLSDTVLRGWNRYTINLISGLVSEGADVCLYLDRDCDPAQFAQLPVQSLKIRQSPRMNYLAWEQQWLPQQCLADRIDVFHAPTHFGLPQLVRAKCLLTLHDAIDEIYYAGKGGAKSISRRVTDSRCWMARRRADHIITVSEHSRQDLIRHFRLPASKVSVTYEAADDRFHEEINGADRQRVRAKYNLPNRYVFYIGSLEPRKNLPFLLQAFAEAQLSDLHIVIGGGRASEDQQLHQTAAQLGISNRLVALGRVHDADLPAIYAEALAFVYPSEYEGFGLQICEALATGCPVLTSRASCLPEILAGGGETFPLSNTEVLSNLLTKIHLDENYRRSLQARARERSEYFDWQFTARQTLAIYEKVCGASSTLGTRALPAAA